MLPSQLAGTLERHDKVSAGPLAGVGALRRWLVGILFFSQRRPRLRCRVVFDDAVIYRPKMPATRNQCRRQHNRKPIPRPQNQDPVRTQSLYSYLDCPELRVKTEPDP
jgi:hypothetical protein